MLICRILERVALKAIFRQKNNVIKLNFRKITETQFCCVYQPTRIFMKFDDLKKKLLNYAKRHHKNEIGRLMVNRIALGNDKRTITKIIQCGGQGIFHCRNRTHSLAIYQIKD